MKTENSARAEASAYSETMPRKLESHLTCGVTICLKIGQKAVTPNLNGAHSSKATIQNFWQSWGISSTESSNSSTHRKLTPEPFRSLTRRSFHHQLRSHYRKLRPC